MDSLRKDISNLPFPLISLRLEAISTTRLDASPRKTPGAKAGVVARFFFDSASLQDPGTIRGGIRYQGSLGSSENREFSGSLELEGVQIPVEAFLQPLRQVTGKVTFDEEKIDFKRVEAHLGETAFNLDGRWRYSKRPQLNFTFDSQDLDLGYLFSQITPETSALDP